MSGPIGKAGPWTPTPGTFQWERHSTFGLRLARVCPVEQGKGFYWTQFQDNGEVPGRGWAPTREGACMEADWRLRRVGWELQDEPLPDPAAEVAAWDALVGRGAGEGS